MNVLLATDGSADSAHAAALLARLPLPESSRITVLAVTEQSATPDAAGEHVAAVEAAAAEMSAEADGFVRAAETTLAPTGWEVRGLVRHGPAAEQIVATAEAAGCNLIVLGWRGRSALGRFLLGSVARAVAMGARCSVLVTRPGGPPPATDGRLRLLLAYDDSEPARGLVRTLASLPLRGRASVHLVTVMEMATYFRHDILQRLSESWQADRRAAEVALEAAAETMRRSTDEVSAALLERPDASDALLDEIEESRSDVVLVGSTGRTGFQRLLLGSVSDRLLTHAPCSVWIGREFDA